MLINGLVFAIIATVEALLFACHVVRVGMEWEGIATAGALRSPGEPMRIRLAAISAAFAIGLAVLPSSTEAQYYPYYRYYPYYPCSPFPLAWPFCVAGAIVGTAAMIVTVPFWVLTGPPPYYWPPLNRPPPYFLPNAPPNYYRLR